MDVADRTPNDKSFYMVGAATLKLLKQLGVLVLGTTNKSLLDDLSDHGGM